MSEPIRLSAVIIAYNEERHLARCLQSLQGVADEVVVVDSGSTDATVAICRRMGARVVQHPFEGFGRQKNYAVQQAQYDWILNLDADEALDDTLRQSLIAVKQAPAAQAYFVRRRNNFCGQWIRYGAWYPDVKIRFWNRTFGQWTDALVHEQVVLREGTATATLKGHLLHYTADNVEQYRQHLSRFAAAAARAMYQQGRAPAGGAGLRAAWMFVRSYLLRLGFLDGRNGWIIARLIAEYTYMKYDLLNTLYRSGGKTP